MNAFIAELAVYSRQGHVLVTLSDPVNALLHTLREALLLLLCWSACDQWMTDCLAVLATTVY